VFVDDLATSNQMWLSRDALTWNPIDAPLGIVDAGMKPAFDGGRLVGIGAGNLIIFVADDESGQRDLWVWELQG
jgi:hypothetical protein